MDGNFSEMVQSVMSDPNAMSQLMTIAKGLMPEAKAESQSDNSSDTSTTVDQDTKGLVSKIKRC